MQTKKLDIGTKLKCYKEVWHKKFQRNVTYKEFGTIITKRIGKCDKKEYFSVKTKSGVYALEVFKSYQVIT